MRLQINKDAKKDLKVKVEIWLNMNIIIDSYKKEWTLNVKQNSILTI